MFGLGMPEVILILVIALVVYGPAKLPEMGASFGKAIREFRNGLQEAPPEKRAYPPADAAAARRRAVGSAAIAP